MAGWILTFPFFLLLLLFILGSCNPMATMFQFPFEVKNGSAETVWITPLGSLGQHTQRRILPQFAIQTPPILAFRRAGFKLRSDETIRIIYDNDDTILSEIVIQDQHGNYKQLKVEPGPKDSPEANRFIIPRLTHLPPAKESLIQAASEAQFNLKYWLINLLGIIFFILFITWKKLTKKAFIASKENVDK